MKFNKWTLGLAAVGVVSLASAARADEKMSSLQTALSNTTISGYVSASFNWAVTPGNYQDTMASGIPFQGAHVGDNKENGFNLDVVKLSIAKPQDESPWASGYQVDLLFGPDAVGYNPSANGSSSEDFAIKQAYVVLRTPVGNGIDWKVGVFDSIIGYEVFDAGSNPNYTRSWGYAIEPTEMTGVLATYKITDEWSVSAGIANTLMAGINTRAQQYGPDYNNYRSNDWNKTFMGSVTFTAPSSWGWAAGSSFYAGIVYGFTDSNSYVSSGASHGYHANGDQVNYYAGTTLNTPWKQLTVGAAFDYAHNFGGGGTWSDGYWEYNVLAAGLYATFKATDKLSFSARGEYIYGEEVHNHFNTEGGDFPSYTDSADAEELTGTMEYDLWANVISRLEARWDHANNNYSVFGDHLENQDSVGLYANIIYKF
jgi:hypothetical protein